MGHEWPDDMIDGEADETMGLLREAIGEMPDDAVRRWTARVVGTLTVPPEAASGTSDSDVSSTGSP